jgi:RNA polymerase sigma factor for flagellar operon FliA
MEGRGDGDEAVVTPTDERDALLRRYLPLVRRVARRHLDRAPGADLDDLMSWGTMGLLDALARYDPRRTTLFSTYARFRIRGAILDQLRALDWVPRSVREQAAAVERTARLLEARLGRPPTEAEVASALGLSLSAYHACLGRITPAVVVSLDATSTTGEHDLITPEHTAPGPLVGLLQRELLRAIGDVIRCLPERDQLLLALYYRDELTMKDVGLVLGLTESRVSQLHSRCLHRLRMQFLAPEPSSRRRGGVGRGGDQSPARQATRRTSGITSAANSRRLRSASAAGMPA